jgi:type VI secretion system protein ImpL
MSNSLPPSSPEQELIKLREQFKGAIKFLTKTRLANKQPLSSLPWCILLGPENAGKTSLLAHSEQDFILTKKSHRLNLLNPSPTQYCDWWATKQVIYADTSGSFSSQLCTDVASENWFSHPQTASTNSLWQETVRLLKNYYRRNRHVAVIVVLSVKDLSKGKDSSLAKSIARQLQDLRQQFGKPFGKPFPLYLVINKLDELTGFNEFFYDLSQEERSQPWGYQCAGLTSEQISEYFEQSLTKLNSQLLFRMQGQAQLAKKAAIYDFPTAMANLKPQLLNFLTHSLPATDKKLAWQSIHFASGASRRPSQASKDLRLRSNDAPTKATKAYFVEHLLQNLVTEHTQEKKVYQARIRTWYQRGIYLLAGITISLAVSGWAYQFNQQLAKIQHIEKALAEFNALSKTQINPSLTANISLLDSLAQASALPYSWFMAERVRTLQTAAHNTYRLALQKLLLPALIANFEHQLDKPVAKEPDQLYATLRAYLMLNDAPHRKIKLIAAALYNWPQTKMLSSDLLQHLDLHLQNLLSHPLPTLGLKQPLIAAARLRLNSLNKSALAYLVLKNQQAYPGITLYKISPEASITMPDFYMRKSLQAIYQGELRQACQEALTGNWVLGNSSQSQDATMQAILQTKVSDIYISDYAHEWQRVLAEFTALPLFTPLELLQQLDDLIANDSALLQTLQLMVQQTTLADLTQGYSPELVNRLATKFAPLQQLINEQNQWQNLQQKIRALRVYLLQMQINGDEEAYNVAKTHLLAPSAPNAITQLAEYAKQLPNPWQAWLALAVDSSWQLIALRTQAYLAQLWQQQVFAAYEQKLANRFPFAADVQQEVSLTDFSLFFAPNGLLDSYFSHYLRPFIDTSSIPWQLKKLANQTIAINPAALIALQQAAIIQRMFYPVEQAKPALEFKLLPLAIDARITSLSLVINGQQLSYPADDTSLTVIWPGDKNMPEAKLVYQDQTGTHPVVDFKGPWALFRLLQQGTLLASKDPKHFVLAMNVNTKLIQLELISKEPLSPFTRDLLSQFILPEKI